MRSAIHVPAAIASLVMWAAIALTILWVGLLSGAAAINIESLLLSVVIEIVSWWLVIALIDRHTAEVAAMSALSAGALLALAAYQVAVSPPFRDEMVVIGPIGLPTVASLEAIAREEGELQANRNKSDDVHYVHRWLRLALHRAKWWMQGER